MENNDFNDANPAEQIISETSINKFDSVTDRLKKNKRIVIFFVTLLILLFLVVLISLLTKPPRITQDKVIDNFSQSPTQSISTETKDTANSVDEEDETWISWFVPYHNSSITNKQPTFFGKVFQKNIPLLESSFALEGIPYNEDEKRYYLRFFPGKVNNISVFVDGEKINEVYGVPQYPTVQCDILNPNPNGSTTYRANEGLYGNSPNLEPITSAEECLDIKRDNLPPVLMFFKTTDNLSLGDHTIKIVYEDEQREFKFFVEDISDDNIQKDFSVRKEAFPFRAADSCPRGYHYRKDYLHIPLADYVNTNTYTKLYLPQNVAETNYFNPERIVYLTIGGISYELFLPPGTIFYANRELNKFGSPPSNKYLFMPISVMSFANGSDIRIWDGPGEYYAAGYLELVPVDKNGYYSYENKLHIQTINSSMCDG